MLPPNMPKLGFWKHAQDDPEARALVTPEGREITRGDLLAGANQIVHGLRALGLERGDAVGVICHNGAEFIETAMACYQAGWYLVPINWHLTGTEMAYILRDSGSKAVIGTERFADACKVAVAEAGMARQVCFAVGEVEGFRAYDELKAGQPTTMPDNRVAGGPMNYTSGTTGRPKGVRRPMVDIDPETMSTRLALFLALFGMMPGQPGVHMSVAPLYHTAVLQFATSHLHLGHSVVLMDKWTPEGCLEVIDRYKVTNSHMVPTMFIRMLKLPAEVRARYDVSSLSHMIHSAAPCPVDVKQQMLEWWGPVVYEYYAASEGGGTTATPQDWLKKPGTVGKPWPISRIRILDDDKQPVEAGQVGTIWISMGEHSFEYHEDEEKTRNSWHEGFFTVGDAGYLDEDGFLFLADRKVDMIISGGVNIYPAEIESTLVMHPKVADVAVFGVPDDDWGESVMAVIETVEGVDPSPELSEEILAWARDKLAKYKWPRQIDYTDEMPRDPTGKLYKRKLRDPYWEGKVRGGAN